MRREPLCLLLVGSEGYGVRRGLLSFAQDVARRDIPLTVAALEEGATTVSMRDAGHHVLLAPQGDRPPITSNSMQKAVSYVRRYRSQLTLVPWLTAVLRNSGATDLLVRSPPELLLAGLAARRAGARAFWLMPAGISEQKPFHLNRAMYALLMRGVGVVPIANSHFTQTTLGMVAHRSYVAHLGIDPAEFPPIEASERAAMRARLGLPHDACVFGIFGRMTPNKGQKVFAEAAASLDASDLHLLLCGGPVDTPYFASIVDLAASAGMAGRCHMEGPVDNVRDYYAACDVVVNSRIDPEPFGFSVIEAMMLERPVLAHAAGGPGETLVDGETGWLVQSPTAAGFEDGLRRAMSNRRGWPELGARARERALKQFTHTAMVDRVLAIMEEEHRGNTLGGSFLANQTAG